MYAANHRTVSCCVVGAKCVENERYRQGGGGGSHDIGAEESLVVYIRRHHLWEEVESHDTVREQGITGLH
jgi:hypothetical protein